MEPDLTGLVGRSLDEVEFLGHDSWRLQFGGPWTVRADCPWRLVHRGGIAVSSVDHGHKYGLPHPVDAAAACLALVADVRVRSARVRDGTQDVVVEFESGARLEVLPLSAGYESWQVVTPDGRVTIAQGGGGLATFAVVPPAGPDS